MDHSDEKNCKHDCTSAERKCRNGVCLAKEKFCDGADDCTDGSDEFECFNPATPPNYQSFMCDSATEYTCNGSTPVRCIKYEQLCMNNNSANDCPVSVCAKTICKRARPLSEYRCSHVRQPKRHRRLGLPLPLHLQGRHRLLLLAGLRAAQRTVHRLVPHFLALYGV